MTEFVNPFVVAIAELHSKLKSAKLTEKMAAVRVTEFVFDTCVTLYGSYCYYGRIRA